MRLLAQFTMGNRMRAVMVVSGFGVLGLVMPPLSLLSVAALALVTLRRGLRDGLETLLFSSLAATALGFVVLGNGFGVAGYLLIQWLPILGLAGWLRASRSLAKAIVAAMGLAGGVILLQLLWADANQWQAILGPLEQAFAEAQLLDAAGRTALIGFLAAWMTGILAVGFFLQGVFALLLARWWQATLYNPGGFQQEFHQLRLPPILAPVALGILALTLLTSSAQPGVAEYLALLVLAAGFVQGLALIHGAVGIRRLNKGWLVTMYLLMFIALVQTATILAAAGLADVWFDFRSRLRGKEPPPSDGPEH